MQVTMEIEDDKIRESCLACLLENDREDPLGTALSIIWENDEPFLYFCPDWPIEYEARWPLLSALLEALREIDGSENEDVKIDLLKRLIAVFNPSKRARER